MNTSAVGAFVRAVLYGLGPSAPPPPTAVAPLVLAGDLQASLEVQRQGAASPERPAFAFELGQPVYWRTRRAWVQGRAFDPKLGETVFDVIDEWREIAPGIRTHQLRARDGAWWGQQPARREAAA